MKEVQWNNKSWEKLTKEEIEEIFIIRSKVFVVEQNCVYQDIDNNDQKAIHVFGKKQNKIIAYSRAFNEGDFFKETSFGRALVDKKFRGKEPNSDALLKRAGLLK